MEGHERPLGQQIYESPGMRILGRLKELAFSFNVFAGNDRDLRKACGLIEHPENGPKIVHATYAQNNFVPHMEANRFFHNYVAAAFTLVDHTRNFMRSNYGGSPLLAAYQDRVNQTFVTSPVARFVQDLRNFFVHRSLPDNSMNMTYQVGQPLSTTVGLKTKSIGDWDGWTSLSRQYLDAASELIPFSKVYEEYTPLVTEMHSWLNMELQRLHSEELDAVEQLLAQLPHHSAPTSGA